MVLVATKERLFVFVGCTICLLVKKQDVKIDLKK